MRSLFGATNNITLPPNAGPGDARIVIASQLPPPLNSYVPDGAYPFATGLSGAIIIYSEGDDEQFVFIAGVEDGAGVEIGGLIVGFVSGGVVMEYTPGTPLALMWKQLGLANTTQIITRAHAIQLLAAADVLIGADDTITVSAATLASLIGASVEVTATSGGDILLDGTDVVVDGQLRWRTGGGSDANTVESTDNSAMSGTNTTYGATMTGGTAGSVLGVAFVAPPSGAVVVLWRAGMDNTTAAGVAYCAPQLRDGAVVNAGTLVTAAADPVALQHEGTAQRRGGTFDVIFGLTAGASYNFTLMQRSSAGANTAAFADRALAVVPVFAA